MARIAYESVPNREMIAIHVDRTLPDMPWISIDKATKEGKELQSLIKAVPGGQGCARRRLQAGCHPRRSIYVGGDTTRRQRDPSGVVRRGRTG